MSKRQTEDVLLAPPARMTIGKDKLELRFRGERNSDMHNVRHNGLVVIVLENMRKWDRAFNSILGFSGVRWQCLQKTPEQSTRMENGKENARNSLRKFYTKGRR